MAELPTGDVNPGDVVTFGWDYYEERNYLILVVKPFNVREQLETFWRETRDKIVQLGERRPRPGNDLDYNEGFKLFTYWLIEKELAAAINPVIEIRPDGSTSSNPLRDCFKARKRMSTDVFDPAYNQFDPDEPVEVLWDVIVAS